MKKVILCAVLAIASMGAYASETAIDTSNLSAAQIAEIKSIAANKVAENEKQKAVDAGTAVLPKDPTTLATVAATWGQQASTAAEGFAHALAIAAKELGITINEFLATPAGKLTAVLIVWKVAGAALIHLCYGIFIVVIGQCLSRFIYLRLFTKEYQTVEYSRFGGLFKGTKLIRVPKAIGELRTDGEWLALWMVVLISGFSLLIGGLIII